MADTQPGGRPAGAAPKAAGKKYAGLTRPQWTGVGLIAAAGLAILIIRRRQQAKNAAAQQPAAASAGAAGAGAGTCPDGSVVDCGGLCPDGSAPSGCDNSGELATLQTELGQLESALSQGGGGGVSGGGTTGTGTATGTATGTTTTTTGTTTTSSGSGSAARPATPAAKVPAMPTGVSGTAASSTSIRLSWGKAAGATSYQVRVTYQGKLAKSATVTGTSAVISGLGADHTYTCHVKACNAAGCSAETGGPVVKTPKG